MHAAAYNVCDDSELRLPFRNEPVPSTRRVILNSQCFDLWTIFMEVELHLENFRVPPFDFRMYKEISRSFYKHLELSTTDEHVTPLIAFLMQQMWNQNPELETILTSVWEHRDAARFLKEMFVFLSSEGRLVYVVTEASIYRNSWNCKGFWDSVDAHDAPSTRHAAIRFSNSDPRSVEKIIRRTLSLFVARNLEKLYDSTDNKLGEELRVQFDKKTFQRVLETVEAGLNDFELQDLLRRQISDQTLSKTKKIRAHFLIDNLPRQYDFHFRSYVPFNHHFTEKMVAPNAVVGRGSKFRNSIVSPIQETSHRAVITNSPRAYEDLNAKKQQLWNELKERKKQWLVEEKEYLEQLAIDRKVEAERFRSGKIRRRNEERHNYEQERNAKREKEKEFWIQKLNADRQSVMAEHKEAKFRKLQSENLSFDGYVRYLMDGHDAGKLRRLQDEFVTFDNLIRYLQQLKYAKRDENRNWDMFKQLKNKWDEAWKKWTKDWKRA